jgi:RNA polymerase sigma factor (sigma-70 family)
MSDTVDSIGSAERHRAGFPTTHWSVVLRARQCGDTREFKSAFDRLYRAYWYPLYAYARRWGRSPDDSQDLTQGFFTYVLEKDLFAVADSDRGKLRTFLLTAFSRYLMRERDRGEAGKRGGGQQIESLDEEFDDGERRYRHEPADRVTPERLFDQAWAHSILDSAKAYLAAKEAGAGRAEMFRILEPYLERGSSAEMPYKELAMQIGLKEAALRQTIKRLRDRYREAVRTAIADTLTEPTDQAIEEELRDLRAALDSY